MKEGSTLRVEIYQYNDDKILKASNALGISVTDMINKILDSINIITEVRVEKVDLNFNKMKLESNQEEVKTKPPEKKRQKLGGGDSFVKHW